MTGFKYDSELFALPDNVWGYLDWTTTCLRINLDMEAWEAFLDEPNEGALGLRETLLHEMLHKIQTGASGFMFRFALETTAIFTPYAGDFIQHFVHKDVNVRNPGWDRIAKEFPKEVLTKLENHYGLIDHPGVEGITIRDIIESWTMLIPRKILFPNMKADDYFKICKYLPQEYKNAYLFMVETCGIKAFELLPVAAFLALLFAEPHLTFVPICRQIALKNYGFEEVCSQSTAVKDLIGQGMEYSKFLGTSQQLVTKYFSGKQPPMYPLLIPMVNQLCAKRNENIVAFMGQAHEWLQASIPQIGFHVTLNPDNFLYIQNKEIRVRFEAEHQLLDHKLIGLLSGMSLIAAKMNVGAPKFFKSSL